MTDVVTYSGAPQRLQAARGPATDHRCVGCEQPASTWALRLTALETFAEVRYGRLMRYSLDSVDYWPACRSCHARYDRRHPDPAPHGKELLIDLAELADLHLIGQGATLVRWGW